MNDRKTPKCPWCGTEMAIAGIIHESKYYYFCSKCGCHSPTMDTREAAYAAAVKRVEIERATGKWHLCDTCALNFPECHSMKIIFGDDVGNDNTCFCDAWEKRIEPLQKPLTHDKVHDHLCKRHPLDIEPLYTEFNPPIEFAFVPNYRDAYNLSQLLASQGDKYGIKWRCWLRKPTEEEQKAAKWEGENDD